MSQSRPAEAPARLDAQAWLAAIVESSDDAIISKNLDGIVTSWNRAAERIFGYSAAEMIGAPVRRLAAPGHEHEMPRILARIRAGERVDHFETVRRRKDGRVIDIALTVSPIRDRSGHVIGASKIARDISGRKEAERRQQVLLGELSHRVNNTLATAQSLAALTKASSSGRDYVTAFQDRLQALATTHALLTRSNWYGADLADLIRCQVKPCAERITLHGENVWLDANGAIALGLALHELYVNGVAHGPLGQDGGTLAVNWGIVAEGSGPSLKLTWQESGAVIGAPGPAAFGRNLMDHLLGYQLGGTVDLSFAADGLRCDIACPLANLTAGAVYPVITAEPSKAAQPG